MYAYQLHPVKIYPFLEEMFANSLYCSFYHNAVNYVDEKNDLYKYSSDSKFISMSHAMSMKEAESQGMIHTSGNLPTMRQGKSLDLILGPFSSDLIKTHKSFTLWQNPVEHVYAMYTYLKSLENHPLFKTRLYGFFVFEKTLENFVDDFIENDGLVLDKYGNSLIPELLRISRMPKHTFVGAVEYIDDWIEKVQDHFKILVPRINKMKFEKITENYRKSDLEKLLKDDMEIFEKNLP